MAVTGGKPRRKVKRKTKRRKKKSASPSHGQKASAALRSKHLATGRKAALRKQIAKAHRDAKAGARKAAAKKKKKTRRKRK